MKHLITITALAFLVLTASCRREQVRNGDEEVTVNLTASVPKEIQPYATGNAPATRSSDDGGATNVTDKGMRFILGVYTSDGTLVKKEVKNAGDERQASFSVRLLAKQYKFVFWADFVTGKTSDDTADLYYNTEDLKDIYIIDAAYCGNQEARDAYTAVESVDLTASSAAMPAVTLKRPFGKVRVVTTDIPNASNYTPTSVTVTYAADIAAGYNALEKTVSPTRKKSNVSFTAVLAEMESVGTDGKCLAIDYLLPTGTAQNITISTTDGSSTTTKLVENVPVSANKLTTLKGGILTNGANITVQVDDQFEGADGIYEVKDIAAVNEALKGGSTEVTVTDPVPAGQTVEIPARYTNTENVSINLPAGADGVITFAEKEYEGVQPSENNTPDSLVINMPSGQEVVINMPNTTVVLNGTTYDKVASTTAASTLVIPEGTTVGELAVNKGGVKILGTVTNMTINTADEINVDIYGTLTNVPSDRKNAHLRYHVKDAETFATAMANTADSDTIFIGEVSLDMEKLEITKPLAIQGVSAEKSAINAPVFCSADVYLGGLTVRPSAGTDANGVEIKTSGISVSMEGVDIYVSSTNSGANKSSGVILPGVDNVTVDMKDCNIVIPKGSQRGVNMFNSASGTCTVTLDNTHIGPTLEHMVSDYNQDYTSEQIAAFSGRSDSRGVSFGGPHTGNYVLNMKNGSVIEGVFYAVNMTYYAAPVEVNVDNSVLDGRCAFNIWANGEGAKINVTNNSKLVGRNYFGGPTEVFANIVLESKANGQAAENNVIKVSDSEFHCFNNPQTPTNWQYAADVRSEGVNTLKLSGNTRIYDHSGRLDYAVEVRYWSNEVTAEPSVVFAQGKSGATVLPSNVWNGSSYSAPGKSLDGKYYIGTPEQLAVLTLQAIENMDIVLVRDLDLNNKPWLAKYPDGGAKANNVDGGGHTIYNLNTATKGWDTKDQCAGLFAAFAGTLKNLTVENATVYGSRSGALMGRLDFGTVSGCHVKNVTFAGGAQKLGGFIGFINGQGDILIENCSVEGAKIVNDPLPKDDAGAAVTGDASCQAGGFIGFILAVNHNVTIKNNSINNVVVESGKLWDADGQCASHEFIGNIANNIKYPNSVFTLTGNTIANSSCDAAHQDSWNEYFGFYFTSGAKVEVNGQTVTQ